MKQAFKPNQKYFFFVAVETGIRIDQINKYIMYIYFTI